MTDIGHYLHQIFAHGTEMIMEHLSLALGKNENVECGNSEHKQDQQNHGMHGGCDTDMTMDCAVHDLKKVTRYTREASGVMRPDLPVIQHDAWIERLNQVA